MQGIVEGPHIGDDGGGTCLNGGGGKIAPVRMAAGKSKEQVACGYGA